jgi:hypothetical protein
MSADTPLPPTLAFDSADAPIASGEAVRRMVVALDALKVASLHVEAVAMALARAADAERPVSA